MTDPREVLTRPFAPPHLHVSYGDHPEQVADVWLPAGSGPAPLVVVVHGGFWRAVFDRSHAGPQCVGLADAGYAVAAIEYRRTGAGGGWPTTFDDVAAAVDTVPGLVAGAVAGRFDRTAVVLVGHSAGGQLALWAASRHRLPPGSRLHRGDRAARAHGVASVHAVRAVVGLAAVADLVACDERNLGDGAVQALLGGGHREVGDRYAQTDPAALAPAGVPATLLHGDGDLQVPLALSRRYTEAATAVGGKARLEALEGVDHFALIDPASRAWPAVLQAVAWAATC
jgi:acetyl esterase/lipase